jgi:hypothetical protein
MNQRQAERLEKKALPCPFCGQCLVAKSDHHGWWVAHEDEPGDCIDSVTQLMGEDDLAKWNTRNGVEHVVQLPK